MRVDAGVGRGPLNPRSDAMADVLFLVLIFGFLAACLGLVELCDRI
ncbi:MAG: hypothetical protein ACT4PE_06755 [Candidatus Eiseniibacteriota bacterium]